MRALTGHQIRESFFRFFEQRDHKRLPSASLIPQDPQLLFTVAGMVPFKPIFWGKQSAPSPRIVTCQKCVRTVDIERVGYTPRHHTFFEMLGNFSFGDYYVKETILWAWEYVTNVLDIPEDRLCVSIYEEDEDAYEIWRHEVGLSSSKITRLGKKDNFWGPVGPSGPCGPDSEIFFDRGADIQCPQPDFCNPACDCGRYLEIWNLVFTGLNQDEQGYITPLAKKNIDTGAGLDRIASVLQGVSSNFETDLFHPIMEMAQDLIQKTYGASDDSDVALRVISDHVRSATFLIADGVLPSNEGRGYVLKRIIRRAMRFGWVQGVQNPFLHRIVPSVIEVMHHEYPELTEKKDLIRAIVQNEEERFLKTMSDGLIMIDELFQSKPILSSSDIFRLYDTFGFPVEVVEEMLQEKGQEMDWEGFHQLMEEQKTQARASRGDKSFGAFDPVYDRAAAIHGATEFIGYNFLSTEATLLEILVDGDSVPSVSKGKRAEVIVEKSPFYPEKGGQVSDIGSVEGSGFSASVLHVFSPCHDIIVHQIEVQSGMISVGDKVNLIVNRRRRLAVQRNHTATHLLHKSLREKLGGHVRQSGSWVGPDRLRFDFTHYKPVTTEEIHEIENQVNESIMAAEAVTTNHMTFAKAKESGAIGLFEERYGSDVRVVQVGSISQELCGGTHVQNTGEIGSFAIQSESAVASGIRRIEAVTGEAVLQSFREQSFLIRAVSDILQTDSNHLLARCKEMVATDQELKKQNLYMQKKLVFTEIPQWVNQKVAVGDIPVIVATVNDLDTQVIRELADRMVGRVQSGVAIIMNVAGDEQVQIAVKVSQDLVNRGIHAGKTIRIIAQFLDGNGGGKPDFAQAGAKSPKKIALLQKELDHLLYGLWNQ